MDLEIPVVTLKIAFGKKEQHSVSLEHKKHSRERTSSKTATVCTDVHPQRITRAKSTPDENCEPCIREPRSSV
eukprot:108816-Pleurochrysis_carterae.AAC.1